MVFRSWTVNGGEDFWKGYPGGAGGQGKRAGKNCPRKHNPGKPLREGAVPGGGGSRLCGRHCKRRTGWFAHFHANYLLPRSRKLIRRPPRIAIAFPASAWEGSHHWGAKGLHPLQPFPSTHGFFLPTREWLRLVPRMILCNESQCRHLCAQICWWRGTGHEPRACSNSYSKGHGDDWSEPFCNFGTA